MPLKHEYFALAQKLAGRLWSIYSTAHSLLKEADVVEPKHENLDDRPSMVLKQLCASQYLDCMRKDLSDEQQYAVTAGLRTFEQEHMGNDCVRPVFVTDV
jgi:hypothetical protein